VNTAIVALTAGGAETALRLKAGLLGLSLNGDRVGAACVDQVDEVDVFLPQKMQAGIAASYYDCTTAVQIEKIFARYEGMILIMAAGIAVRALAPLLQGKEKDPAVVVVDERGQFAVSLLSGHLGGANDLARAVSSVLGAAAVITTSTDVQGYLAVDVLARDLGVKVEPVSKLAAVNGAVARGEKVLLLSEFPLPLGREHRLWADAGWQVEVCGEQLWDKAAMALAKGDLTVLLTAQQGSDSPLYLRPPSIVAGVGCRKGMSGNEIIRAVQGALELARRSSLSLKKLVSIEAKAQEEGILQATAHFGVDTEFYPAETLRRILSQDQGLAQSSFVNTQMGVGGVCEPASLAGCRQGKLILGKQAKQGVTVALAEEEFGW